MARTYDVYLRNTLVELDVMVRGRLSECDMVIQNLPYRDRITVYATLYLDAVIDYLCLQKLIVGKHNMAIQAEIDRILERVFNEFTNNSSLAAELSATMNQATGVSSGLILKTLDLGVQEESFAAAPAFMNLTSAALHYDLQKLFNTDGAKMTLTTRGADTVKTAFEKFNGLSVFSAATESHAEKHTEAWANLPLRTDEMDIFHMAVMRCEALMNLACEADCGIWFSLGSGTNALSLSAHMGDLVVQKYCPFENVLSLLGEINEKLVGFISLDAIGAALDVSVAASMRRYRRLNEIDPFAFSEIDAMSVEALDYIVLD